MVKSGFVLLAVVLLSTPSLAATSNSLTVPVTVEAASEEFFSQLSFEQAIQDIREPEFAARRRQYALGATDLAFRTLGEAAAAGINPLENTGANVAAKGRVVVTSEGAPSQKPLWPAFAGGVALLAVAFVCFILALTARSRKAAK